MKKMLLILALAVGSILVVGTTDAAAQGKRGGMGHGNKTHTNWSWHKKDAHGYRNYGQYRRTQVGNRRFRTVRRYSWIDGVRRARMVRVYY